MFVPSHHEINVAPLRPQQLATQMSATDANGEAALDIERTLGSLARIDRVIQSLSVP